MSDQNPILRDFPDTIETSRLLIRALRPGDGPVMNAAIRESLDELRPWFPWALTAPTVEENETYAREVAADWVARKQLGMLIFRREDGLCLGGTGFQDINWTVPRVGIGYWLRTSQTGQGYMTECVAGLTRFAFEELGVYRIEIRCDSRNTRSAAVARRAGYTLEGTIHNHGRGPDGSLRDWFVFAQVRAESE